MAIFSSHICWGARPHNRPKINRDYFYFLSFFLSFYFFIFYFVFFIIIFFLRLELASLDKLDDRLRSVLGERPAKDLPFVGGYHAPHASRGAEFCAVIIGSLARGEDDPAGERVHWYARNYARIGARRYD